MSLLKAFGWAAALEAVSWIALLVSMFFAHALGASWGESAISLVGRIHGNLVIVYIVLLALSIARYRWSLPKIGLDVLALLVPGLGFLVAKNAFAEDRARSVGLAPS